MFTPEERAAKIARIAALPEQLKALVCTLTPEQLTTRYLPGEWTVAQNVHHLADSHMNAYVRLKLMLTEENPTFKPYDQDAWADTPDADHAQVGESLQLLRGLHARWVRLLESLDDAQWQRTGWHPESRQTYTPETILRIYSGHGEGHLDQIRRTLAGA
jgi:hypothetical protein